MRLAELYVSTDTSRPLLEPDVEAAGELVKDKSALLAQAILAEQRDFFHALFNTIYLDGRRTGYPVAAMEPKLAIRLLLYISELPENEGRQGNEISDRVTGVVTPGKCDTTPANHNDDVGGNEGTMAVECSTPVAPNL